MFPPTSRENVDPLWQSPYTLTLSALNSWIGEEVRPVGPRRRGAARRGRPLPLRAGRAWLFGGADTAGALLAWRGWAMGTRLSVVGETLPLPPLPTLAPGRRLRRAAAGRARGRSARSTTASASSVRGRWSRSDVGLLQIGLDRHRAATVRSTRPVRVGNALRLRSPPRSSSARFQPDHRGRRAARPGMGQLDDGARRPAHPRRLRAADLASATDCALTARYDRFQNQDQDGVAEPNGESGWALTVAGFWRASAAGSGSASSTSTCTATVPLRRSPAPSSTPEPAARKPSCACVSEASPRGRPSPH